MQILCENLSIGYGNMVLHHNINFSVNKGDYLCIIGENGCGKSTLMRTLLGLQPPLEGKIVFGDGLEQNEIGYLPQQTAVQKDFPASVREIILSGCQNKCGIRPFIRRVIVVFPQPEAPHNKTHSPLSTEIETSFNAPFSELLY